MEVRLPTTPPSGFNPSSPRSLRQNFSWAFVGNAVYAASQWGLLVVLTRLLPPQDVGEFALAMAITAPVVLFSNLNLRGVITTDVQREYRLSTYLGLRLCTILLALLGISAIVAFAGYGGRTVLVMGAVSLAKAADAVSDIIHGYLQRSERLDLVSSSRIIQGTLQVTSVAATVWWTRSLVAGMLALAVSSLAVTLTLDRYWLFRQAQREALLRTAGLIRLLAHGLDPKRLTALARLAFPLGIVYAMGSLSVNIPRYFVEAHLGREELAAFAAISYIMFAGGMLAASFFQSSISSLATHFLHNRPVFNTLLLKLFGIAAANGVLGLLVAWIGGSALLGLAYGPAYTKYPDLLMWQMLVAAVAYLISAVGTALMAIRCFAPQLWVYAAMVISTIIGCAVLVPTFGLNGAMHGWLIGNVVCLAGFSGILAIRLRVSDATDGALT